MNATDPLTQLRDIHLPDPVSWWPPAIGWWLLAALLLILLAATCWFYKRWQKGRYRRAAIRQINQLFENPSAALASDLNQLLKAVARQSYSSLEVSRLSRDQWLAFLDHSANMQDFSNGSGQALANAPYQNNPLISDADQLKRCCIQWVRRHK